jgi:hypothetical protein
MRTVLVSAAAFMVGFMLSAVAQNTTTSQNTPGQATGCGHDAMSPKTSQGVNNSGFTQLQDVPKAVVVHAVDPDGNPVIMLVAPANQ